MKRGGNGDDVLDCIRSSVALDIEIAFVLESCMSCFTFCVHSREACFGYISDT